MSCLSWIPSSYSSLPTPSPRARFQGDKSRSHACVAPSPRYHPSGNFLRRLEVNFVMERERRARTAVDGSVLDEQAGGWLRRLCTRSSSWHPNPLGLLVGLTMALPLAGCLTAYTREAPGGVYPEGPLSGPPTYFVGWSQTFSSPTERKGKDFIQSPLVRPEALSH
jgi:hypothetical protein